MTAQVAEILEITKSLPKRKVAQVLQFVRSLQPKPSRSRKTRVKVLSEKPSGDAEWERIINDLRPRPKLTALVNRIKQDIRQSKHFEPLDLNKL